MPLHRDQWWEMSDIDTASFAAKDIAGCIVEFALPKTGGLASTQKLIGEWRAGRGAGLTEREIERYLTLLGS